jgi:hypothetical protein
MTLKASTNKRIKDLEQINKLLSDIIMELVKKIPKGDLPKNIIKYEGVGSTNSILKLINEWYNDDKTCSGKPHCCIEECDLCMNCFEELRNKFNASQSNINKNILQDNCDYIDTSQSESVNLAESVIHSQKLDVHSSDRTINVSSEEPHNSDTNNLIGKELNKDYAKVVGSGK